MPITRELLTKRIARLEDTFARASAQANAIAGALAEAKDMLAEFDTPSLTAEQPATANEAAAHLQVLNGEDRTETP